MKTIVTVTDEEGTVLDSFPVDVPTPNDPAPVKVARLAITSLADDIRHGTVSYES